MKTVKRMSQMVWGLVILAILVTNFQNQTYAQDIGNLIFTTNLPVVDFRWTPDSQRFFFQLGTPDTEGNLEFGVVSTWYQYDTTSQQLQVNNSWSLQPNLTLEQIQSFEIASDGEQQSFIFPSPNGRYIVYAAQRPPASESLTFPLGIADLITGTHRIFMNIGVRSLDIFSREYNINWSTDSSAFTVYTESFYGSEPRVDYVSGFALSLNDTTVQSLHRTGLLVNGEVLYPDDVFDFSNSGKKILLRSLRSVSPLNYQLILWNIENPSESRIIKTGYFRDAMFSPDNDSILVYVDENGLNMHNLTTGNIKLIDASLNSYLASSASIAPNGQDIVFTRHRQEADRVEVYHYRIPATTIGNKVWLDKNGDGVQNLEEKGIPNVTINLLNNSFSVVDTTISNINGFYTFADLVPGTHYYIQIIPPADTYTIAPVDRGADDTRDSDFDWRDNFGTPDPTDRVLRSMRFTASAGMQRDDLDAGFMPNSDLRVRVWRDTDGDGVQDTGEQGMAGVSLFLRRANFTRYRDPLTTDSDGFVTFTNLPAGDYYVQINVPSGYSLAPFNIGTDDNIDNDFVMAFNYETGSGNVPRTLRFTLAPGVIREDMDAGLKQP